MYVSYHPLRSSKLEDDSIKRRQKIFKEEEKVNEKELLLEFKTMERDLNETKIEVNNDKKKLANTLTQLQKAQNNAQNYRIELSKGKLSSYQLP